MKRTILLLCSLAAGCGMKAGTLDVTIYGEEFIEDGIPAEVFSDGWAMSFEKFLISVGGVSAASGEQPAAFSDDSVRIFDLAKGPMGAGHAVLSRSVAGGAYDHVGFRVAPPASSAIAANAAAADRDLMASKGYSLYIEATATKGMDKRTLAWGFSTATRYGGCQSTAVVDGATARSQLTIHADHLFYDDLFSPEPNVSFEVVAGADKDKDGTVTVDELKAVDITPLDRYQVGNEKITNLLDFIRFQTGTVGHIDGEGHCEEAVRE